MIKHIAYLTMAMATCVLTGCHSSKNASDKYNGDIDTSVVNEASIPDLYSQLVSSYKPWTDLYVPVQLSLESPKKMSISGRATMVYGKEIYISLRVLGMEVGYVYIDDTKAYVVDKYHKYYFAEDLSKLIKGYDISITDLQDLLLGRAILPGIGVITEADADKFTYLTSDDNWLMTPTKQYDGVDWHYTASKTQPPMLSAVSMRLSNAMAMECRFTEPTNTTAGIVDGVCTLTLPYKSKDLQVSITWMLNDAKWDSGREIKFTPPSDSYRRLDVESLIKSMSTE